ncbi:hypothetical protein G8764_09885 [Pseudomaricurvus alcaniphilus]|uniref:hypothetical protein n=1 Tax=Pseudomaricurvus alcaniphilus TaxID=1166482 RepID=UPI001408E422|nr:hypothetical protein [Pseudomaricurvus alcaniphilus]NHN37602.1 hypothetical protein [Pseudomaricurvus alcaniphilus]
MEKSKKLILHIGFPKTGSTAIQSALAKVEEDLSKNGVTYAGFPEEAKKNKITSGNGVELVQLATVARRPASFDEEKFIKSFVDRYFKNNNTAIISSELLGNLNKMQIQELKKFFDSKDLHVIPVGCVRNIYDHTYSLYMQSVKRHGDKRAFSEFHEGFFSPQIRAINEWGSVFDNLKLISYDAVKENLFFEFLALLEVDGLVESINYEAHRKKINRSLTIDETFILTYLNKLHDGVFSQRISDSLLYRHPEKQYSFPVDPSALVDMIKKYTELLNDINFKYQLGGDLKILDLMKLPSYDISREVTSISQDVLDVFEVLVQLCLDQRQEIVRLKSLKVKPKVKSD